ncbi:MAG TPA: hypothetical protein VEA19_01265 [Actinomycetota bacterium]|nr:hypothetical protein [Actinomycetota bacterium]
MATVVRRSGLGRTSRDHPAPSAVGSPLAMRAATGEIDVDPSGWTLTPQGVRAGRTDRGLRMPSGRHPWPSSGDTGSVLAGSAEAGQAEDPKLRTVASVTTPVLIGG